MKRPCIVMLFLAACPPSMAFAQAPATAPVVLSLPTSARVAALGSAWVAGRDQDVIFSNPAQLIGTRSDFAVTGIHLGPGTNGGSFATVYAAGKWSMTLGLGVQAVNFTTAASQSTPFPVETLLSPGAIDAQSMLAVVGGAMQYKTFKIGVSGKYLSDRTSVNRHALVADVGVSRTLFSGVAAAAFQNIGHGSLSDTTAARLPRQFVLGWSTTKPAGPFDLGIFTQASRRSGWTGGAAGLEMGYSWIEGLSVTLRGGLRRPEAATEKPVALGAAISADHFTLDYAMRLFDNGKTAHLVTVRWR